MKLAPVTLVYYMCFPLFFFNLFSMYIAVTYKFLYFIC